MAEAAGLVLGVLGVAGLFSTCIECFDIVCAGKHHSKEFERLSALLALERLRFCIWGQSVGLAPQPDGRSVPYDGILNRADIRPVVEQTLYNEKSLLDDAGRVGERYGPKVARLPSSQLSNSRGMDIFKSSFDQFKSRMRKQQKDISAWHVTRWAIHDAKDFEGTISRLQKFVDGLEKITASNHLAEQRARLQGEIENISDIESLQLLSDASSSYRSSYHGMTDSPSRSLVREVAESVLERRTIASRSIAHGTESSFITAPTHPRALSSMNYTGRTTQNTNTVDRSSSDLNIPGAWPKFPLFANAKCSHPPLPQYSEGHSMDTHATADRSDPGDIPQNKRLMNEIIQSAEPREQLSFARGDGNYGKQLRTIKMEDQHRWAQNSGRFLAHAQAHSSAAKRMFFELRNIKSAKAPFISAAPLHDSLDTVLASIEGPPETPYEGGVFWITVQLAEFDPYGPPLMRFQTKIYHPNISPRGEICADYSDKWRSVLSAGIPVSDPSAVWYPTKTTEIRWSLGALLTALCGLLASPNVDDPLVPEVAQKYIEDYNGYCEAARAYTHRYAKNQRPDENNVVLYEQDQKLDSTTTTPLPLLHKEPEVDTASLQQFWREKLERGETGSYHGPSIGSSESQKTQETQTNSAQETRTTSLQEKPRRLSLLLTRCSKSIRNSGTL